MELSRLIFTGSLICMLAGMLTGNAVADTLVLPQGIRVVDDESFLGCGMINEIIIPEGVEHLGKLAFANCTALNSAIIPISVTEIASDCFSGCGEALLLECTPDSAAHKYALNNSLDYNADTICRALMIGQSYTGTSMALKGTVNDVRAMRFMLMNQHNRPFETIQCTNLSAREILDITASSFAKATAQDISLFYYSGHGNSQGELIGTDEATVTPSSLRSVLDGVPGRKIVIIDACYSGQWVNTVSLDNEVQDFNEAFLSGFLGKMRSAEEEYYIITSARSYEESVETPITSGSLTKVMGCFTYTLCRGCGWDGVTSRSTDMAADVNGDDAVSVAEAFDYAYAQALVLNETQHAQTNSGDCRAFAPFR